MSPPNLQSTAAPVEAVFFDLDGTLLDTLQDLADAGNTALEQLGHPPHPVEAYRYFVGNGMAVLAQRILPGGAADDDAWARCLQAVREAYGRCWDRTSGPYTGVAQMLDGLVGRGLPIGVLSNKPHDFTCLTVEQLLSRWTFAAIQGVDDATPPKPDPTGALRMAAALGFEPANCLYVGDTRVDMETATAAGMVSVGVTWGFRDEEELRTHGARHIIGRPEELLDLT